MGFFDLYDYTSTFRKVVNCALVNPTDLNAISSGSFTYNGNTFTITKTAGNSPYITFTCNTAAYDDSHIEAILNAAHIRTQNLYESILPMESFKLGFDENRTDPPYYQSTWNSSQHYANVTLQCPAAYTSRATTLYVSDHGAAIPIAIPAGEDTYALGIIMYYCHDYVGGQSTYVEISYYPTLTTDNYDSGSGDKGFTPTAARTTSHRPGIGGRPTGQPSKKDPDYASDTVTQPGAPDETAASVVRSGFLNVYQMSEAELNKICGALYSDTLLNAVKNMFINPLDFIVSLMIFPCAPNVAATPTNIKFGKWDAALTGATALGVSITGNKLENGFSVVDFGSINIPENWGNFLDYSQTTLELYLPFIGSVNIDVSECMGGSINVSYTIDYFTGMCVANVLCERSFPLPSGKFIPNRAQHAFQGNCAIQVPLSAESYGAMIGSLINACTQGITNPVGGFMGIAQDAISGGMRPNVTSKGNIVANAGFCSVLYPYVRITRPITAEPDSYQEVMGYPSYINTSLGQCDGLCVCDGINLQSVSGATDNELNKIRQLCAEGVYV